MLQNPQLITPKTIKVVISHWPLHDACQPLSLKVTKKLHDSYLERTDNTIRGFTNFVTRSVFVKESGEHGGLTWIELYLLALAHAPKAPTQCTQAVARVSLNRSIQLFKIEAT
eukprot:4370343-Karenia_brevis.AAC.1